MEQRGQTTQDYVVGISIVLLTVTGVFAFVPAVFETTEDPVERNAYTQAEALGDQLVETHTADGTGRQVSFGQLNQTLTTLDRRVESGAGSPLLASAGIRQDDGEIRRVNVTVTPSVLNDTRPVVAAGDPYVRAGTNTTNRAATVTRFVHLGNESRCGDSGLCQLTVRVW
jgi:hypothetical protein